ncbi:chemotaxis protein CheC [Oceanobacillus alkalisoli]|uniref:chemotaxis protein CheC n=1 Tax=Oceanobacillus alkalisoli TaxID=2925113 RepID=UPI001EF0A1D0|nr:chemotaxis protein CheC [Oceanobacillus alkalisoli]MCF3942411.1 chemotaxis protein CheC [Oceanobacillus alkalisoli]MCG5103468.1 chemotaxis protein CheC [Oceanobacillus alkalisoli]
MKYKSLSSFQFDVLREVGNIGAGNAVTALSQLLNLKIEMAIPSVNVVSFDEMMELIGGPEKKVVAILFRIYGEAPSNVFFVLSVEEAELLIRTMTNNPTYEFKENISKDSLEFSVLEEVGNIVTGSYISALSDFTHLHLQPSVPHLGIDMAAAVLTYGLIDISQASDYAIVIDSKVNSQGTSDVLEGNFFLLPNPGSLQIIFSALGIQENE